MPSAPALNIKVLSDIIKENNNPHPSSLESMRWNSAKETNIGEFAFTARAGDDSPDS